MKRSSFNERIALVTGNYFNEILQENSIIQDYKKFTESAIQYRKSQVYKEAPMTYKEDSILSRKDMQKYKSN